MPEASAIDLYGKVLGFMNRDVFRDALDLSDRLSRADFFNRRIDFTYAAIRCNPRD